MTAASDIRKFARAVVRHFRPQRIILFGSRARNQASRDSDVDLLVIFPGRGRAIDRAADILLKLQPSVALDLLTRSESEVKRRLAIDDWFMRDVVEHGRTLYKARGAPSLLVSTAHPKRRVSGLTLRTREFLRHAENWFVVARRCLRAGSYDHACHAARVSAESYFNAVLQQSGERLGRQPDLATLARRAVRLKPELSLLLDTADALSTFTIDILYPGRNATRAIG